jgi:hypothetical protein
MLLISFLAVKDYLGLAAAVPIVIRDPRRGEKLLQGRPLKRE